MFVFFSKMASKTFFDSFLGALGGHLGVILELLRGSWALLGLLGGLLGSLVGSLGLSWGSSGGFWRPPGAILKLSWRSLFHQDPPRGLPSAIWVDLGVILGSFGGCLAVFVVLFFVYFLCYSCLISGRCCSCFGRCSREFGSFSFSFFQNSDVSLVSSC